MKYSVEDEMVTNEFNSTDDRQWVKKTGENTFTIINISLHEKYYVQEIKVDLLTLTEEDIMSEISVYFDSIEELKLDYPTTWNQFVAETIADHTEVDEDSDKSFVNKNDMMKYLEEAYNIKL